MWNVLFHVIDCKEQATKAGMSESIEKVSYCTSNHARSATTAYRKSKHCICPALASIISAIDVNDRTIKVMHKLEILCQNHKRTLIKRPTESYFKKH
jgi:hypothetical protein